MADTVKDKGIAAPRPSVPRGAGVIVAVLALATGTPARAWGLFPAGSENKGRGMESAVASRGGAAVLYNPANVSATGQANTSAELGFAHVEYAYEHPSYDPVVVTVNSPTVALGHTHRLAPRVSGGFVLFPTKNGETRIPGVPRKIGDDTYAVDVTQKETILNAGYGLAYAWRPGWSAGASLIYSYEKNDLDARLVGSQSRLVTSHAEGHFLRPRLGVTGSGGRGGDAGAWTASASVLPPTRKAYRGDYASNSYPDAHAPRMVNYEPMTLGLGGVGQWRDVETGVDVNYRRWSDGRTVVKSGVGVDAAAADLKDTVERGVHVKWGVMTDLSLLASYAESPSPWGAGSDPGAPEARRDGASFGQLDAIDRRTYALGSSAAVAKDATFDVALMHARGSRKLDAGAANQGFYQLAMTLVSVTLNARF